MATLPALKPTHAPVRAYYLALAQLANVGAKHESAVREAWHTLIQHAAPKEWTLVREYSVNRKDAPPLRLDGVLLDSYRLPHGVIEDKDNADDLLVELRAKLKLGYPAKNILFWQPRRAILVQDGRIALDYFIDALPQQLGDLLARFFAYTEPVIADWERATEEFRERVAELGASLAEVIQRARGTKGTLPNKKFVAAFDDFAALCRAAINPTLADSAIEEMLIQHLLTARLFGTVFKNPDFTRRIRHTFAADSAATLLNKLSDPYIKAIRWASDRIGEEGIVAYVTNSGYLDGIATDGVRAHLAQDFDAIYVIDLGGNVRKNPKLSGTTHNVFGIQVGVSIALFVRHAQKEPKRRKAVIRYAAVGEDWRKERKWKWLEEKQSVEGVRWRTLKPDVRQTWLHDDEGAGFSKFLSMGSKETKALDSLDAQAIFRTYSLGVSTNRDSVVYDFNSECLKKRIEAFCEDYNAEVSRWQWKGRPDDIDGFVRTDRVKWSRDLKEELKAEKFHEFKAEFIQPAAYRPFTLRHLYRAAGIVDRVGEDYFPTVKSRTENRALALTGIAPDKPFMALAVDCICDLHFCSAGVGTQCFPLYTYDADGGHRRDNVTDWALEQFKLRYPGVKFGKRDLFHYVYAVLHHPAYREKYAANLRRELPRIPFAPDFPALARAGEKLAALHTGYEAQKEFKLARVETPGLPADWRVERMKLSKEKLAVVYNDWLTLGHLPPEVHAYRLGNRSALEWVLDQYRVERAKDHPETILSDPNRTDDEQYIVRLVGQVVTVSVETMRLVHSLPPLEGATPPPPAGYTQADLDAAHIYAGEDKPEALIPPLRK